MEILCFCQWGIAVLVLASHVIYGTFHLHIRASPSNNASNRKHFETNRSKCCTHGRRRIVGLHSCVLPMFASVRCVVDSCLHKNACKASSAETMGKVMHGFNASIYREASRMAWHGKQHGASQKLTVSLASWLLAECEQT